RRPARGLADRQRFTAGATSVREGRRARDRRRHRRTRGDRGRQDGRRRERGGRTMNRRLSYANVMATLAFFFALTGGAAAVNKYLQETDPITQGDLVGSTYGNPVVAAGKVTTNKIADGAITAEKLGTSARLWARVFADGSVGPASKPGVTVNHVD